MTRSTRERLKGFLRRRSTNASGGLAARIPVPLGDDSSPVANASQDSPSSTSPQAPNCLTQQSQATGSIPSATPARNSSPAATPNLPPSQTTVSQPQPGQPGQSLWNRAYEALRADDSQLLLRYEKLLSLELPESVITTNTSQNTSGQVESLDLAENRINSDPRTRQDQLKKITDRGMEQADGKRTVYTIFGHEFVLKDQVSQVAQFVKVMKGLVDEAVKVSPEAALAWAGVCVLLPVFTSPSAAEEANRDGLSYVTSRMRYYVELERLLWPENLESQDGLKGEFEGHIVSLYQEILKFQIKTVLRFYERWLKNVSKDVIGSDDWKGMVVKIKDLEQTVRNESSTVNNIASRKRLGDLYDAAKQHDTKLESLLSIAKEHLLVSQEQREISSEQLAEHRRTNQILENRPIDLPIVYEACYDSVDVQDSPKCDDGTRTRIIDDINRWAEKDSEDTLLWLVGPAGTGKSTIARTVADSFARNSRLAAGYFFKRGQKGRNDTNGLNKDAVETKALKFQFDTLFRLPLTDLPPASTKQLPVVIIIDALDECEHPEHLAGILSLLSELRNITQVRLRVMLTSRSAPSIADAFSPLLENKTARRLEIHREFFEDTKTDIRMFLEANFSNIRMKCRVQQNPWPLAEDMDRLVQLATSPEPLFIYAATLCRFVYDHKTPKNPKKQLDRWFEQCEDGKSQLDQIYSPIVAQIFAGNNKTESEQQLQFLGALVLLADPLSASSLATILAVDVDDVTWWLPELHAVLDVPSEPHMPLRLLHKSFSDFLLNSDSSSANPFQVNVAKTHSLLAEKCVQRMEAELEQNICGIRELDATLDDIREEEIDRCIPADIQYACLYWIYHLEGSEQPPGTYVHAFLHDHFLHWLEVLSLLGRLPDGALAIRRLLNLIEHFSDTPLEFVNLVKVAKRVITSFGSIIEEFPLQTYGALLFFAPVTSKVRQIFWNQHMPRLGTIQGVKLDWDAYLQTLEGHSSSTFAIAFSPDSQVIASGSFDSTIHLWSATTGAYLQTLEGHSKAVEVVVFSGNETLASGSRDGTVRIWNLPTGKLLHTLNSHRSSIKAVVFLPDGENLASASTSSQSKLSVRLWNPKTIAPPKELLQSYQKPVRRVDFSPDSQLMALGLSDNTIEILSFPTGIHRCMLKWHRDSINIMVFSLKNQVLASRSYDNTIRLWNLDNGLQIYAFPYRLDFYGAIAFSPDGRFLASSWGEEEIRIWNVMNDTHYDTLPGHQSPVTTVAFSPDNQLLASGSTDKTIKLWDMEIHTYPKPFDRHSDEIVTVAFSPDGQLLATGSRDRTVRVWDVSTGMSLRVLSDHDTWVYSVDFSPDGKLLASYDSAVRIWNVENGTLQQKIDKQSGLVTAVDYSTDGQLAASASFTTVTLYDAQTGRDLFILEGHSNFVEKLVFSPDCQFLASLSQDKTIRLWETNTGGIRHVLRDVYDVYAELVFSPDSQFLASAQYTSLVVWNVMSGAKQQTLEIEDDISIITLSPDNQRLAIQTHGHNDQHAIDLYDMTTDNAWHTLQIFDSYAPDILFSPDSQVFAVAAPDRLVWLWNATTHRHLLTIENPDDVVVKLKFSSDGQILATASGDVIRLWNTTTGFHLQMIQYGTSWVEGIIFLHEELMVLVSSGEGALSWNLNWRPTMLTVRKFSLRAVPQADTSELNTPGLNLDGDQEWITKDSKRLIWLPPEYRPTDWVKRGSTIFIGCASGRLLRVQDN